MERAQQRCGYLPEETWPAAGAAALPPVVIDGVAQECPICPGWLQRQPLVVEVVQAWRAFDKGCLGDAFPDAPSVVVDGVFLFDAAVTQHRAEELEEARRNAESKRG